MLNTNITRSQLIAGVKNYLKNNKITISEPETKKVYENGAWVDKQVITTTFNTVSDTNKLGNTGPHEQNAIMALVEALANVLATEI